MKKQKIKAQTTQEITFKGLIFGITEDYTKFNRKLKGLNRYALKQKTIDKLIESIKELDYSRPILVNKKFEILDGQNRFEARKALGLPIVYEVYVGFATDETIMQHLNIFQTKWGLIDYASHYAVQGIKYHQTILNIYEKHNLPLHAILILCSVTGNGDNGSSWTAFKKGIDKEISSEYLANIKYIKQFSDLPFYKSTFFMRALTRFFKNADNKLRTKLQIRHLCIPLCGNEIAYYTAMKHIVKVKLEEGDRLIG